MFGKGKKKKKGDKPEAEEAEGAAPPAEGAEGAEGADAALQPATLRALHEELAQPPTHAASALELHRAWSRALAAGLPGLPPVLPAPRAGLLAQLTDSLRAHPVQRESFLQRNA